MPTDVLTFPINLDNVTVTDAKQILACESSLRMLEESIKESEYGAGYKKFLNQRATEVRNTLAKLKEKYGLTE